MARVFSSAGTSYLRSGSTPITGPPFTMACWARDALDNNKPIFGVGDSTQGDEEYYLWRHGSIDRLAMTRDTTGTSDTTYASAGSWPAGTWAHICGVFAATNDAALFTNGGDKVTDATDVAAVGWDNVSVGRVASTGLGCWDGLVADLVGYNCALTDGEVWRLYAGVAPWRVRPGNLVLHLPLRYGDWMDRDLRRGLVFAPANGPTWAQDPPKVVKYWLDREIVLWRKLGIAAAAPAAVDRWLALLGVGE